MKKRILSLVLAISMCFTVLPTLAIADDSELFGLKDTIELYTERAWDWQDAQFGAMTDEQKDVIDNAYNAYLDNTDELEALAYSTANDLVAEGGTTFLSAATMLDLYKWKLMRDIMEGNVDISLEGDEYVTWLADFTAFEEANDEAISASKPNAALNGLGDYSKDLSVYYDDLYLIWKGGAAVTGEDADKFVVYANAYEVQEDKVEDATMDEDAYYAYLKEDVVEIIVAGMLDGFKLGIEIACGQRVRGDSIFDEIDDKSMKGAFLLVGEDLTRYFINLVTPLKNELVNLDKRDILAQVASAKGTQVLNGSNETTFEAMYEVMKSVSAYIEGQDFMAEPIDAVKNLGFENIVECRDILIGAAKDAMGILDANHGVELVHFDVYVGRAFLDAEVVDGDGTVYGMGDTIEIEAGNEYEIDLSFSHNRYKFIGETLKNFSIEQFDVETVSGSGIEAVASQTIGVIEVDATAAEPGDEIVINLYRGYNDDRSANEMDAYRYVTTYTIKVKGEPVEPEEPYVRLDDVADTTVDGTITVKGETNLDYVTVSIIKNGDSIYAVVYTKAEFEAGIELNVPDAAEAGDVYTVVVGTEKAAASDEFEIIGATEEYEVTLEDVADTTVDGIITVKGTTTNLDYVTVAIVKDGDTIYAVVYTKAEYEAGITLAAPDNAQVGDVYTVVVGTEKAAASDEFTIVEEPDETEYEVTLEDVADTTVDGTITIKGTTNLDHVTVAIVKDGETIYAVVYTKAEYEAGITLAAPDNAQVDDVYTVVVGTEKASASDDFAIVGEEPTDEPTDEPTEPVISGKLALAGSRTRTANVGKTVVITTTPQNVSPEDATVEVRWTTETGEIIEVTSTASTENTEWNNIATITKLAKGTEKVTATLYVNGVAVDSQTVTIKNPSSGGGGGTVYTTVTAKVDETKDVVKAPTNGVEVEFKPVDGDGVVSVEIVDGVVIVTGVKAGTVKGELVVKNENGNVVSTSNYEFVITEGDKVVTEHECEWPDIAAGWEGKTDAHWAHLTIDAMTKNGYINGYPDGLFKPDQNITRAEFTAIVYRILGLEDADEGVYYNDTVGHWAEEIIATMSLPEAGYGMTRGYGDGNFGPDDYITREQAVAIIARAKSAIWVEATEGAKDIFTDSEDISWWFDGEMDAAVTNGLITGYEDGSYRPLNFTTRAEACTLLARAWPEVLELD